MYIHVREIVTNGRDRLKYIKCKTSLTGFKRTYRIEENGMNEGEVMR